MYNLILALPLGIEPISILLHMLNFILLIVILTFLVHKPVKNFIKNRQDKITNMEDEITHKISEVDIEKQKYQDLIEKANIEIESKIRKAEKETKIKTEAIINQANIEAKSIISKAEEKISHKRDENLTIMRNDISDISLKISRSILEREISQKDNERIIEESLKEWSEN